MYLNDSQSVPARSDGNELSRRELERQIQELRRDKAVLPRHQGCVSKLRIGLSMFKYKKMSDDKPSIVFSIFFGTNGGCAQKLVTIRFVTGGSRGYLKFSEKFIWGIKVDTPIGK